MNIFREIEKKVYMALANELNMHPFENFMFKYWF